MKTFGDTEIEWRGVPREALDGRPVSSVTHVIVATRGSAWEFLCTAHPERYVEIVGSEEKPSTEPVVWKHDRKMVTCEGCLAMLDGATITVVKVSS